MRETVRGRLVGLLYDLVGGVEEKVGGPADRFGSADQSFLPAMMLLVELSRRGRRRIRVHARDLRLQLLRILDQHSNCLRVVQFINV